MKIRINDLARELEVKSKEILDSLPKVGVTEKKTHSSSIEADEAERVKKYFAGLGHTTKGSAKAAEDHRPKIDLSKISKPGDVLKAITERKEQVAHPHAPARPVIAKPVAEPPRPVAPAKTVVVRPSAPAAEKPSAPAAEPPAPEKPAYVPRMITPQSVARPAAVVVIPPSKVEKPAAPPAEAAKPAAPEKPAVAEPPVRAAETPAAEVVKSAAPAEKHAAPVAEKPAALPSAPGGKPGTHPTSKPHAPAAHGGPPPRRLIVPQTGPRPVYTAPVRPAAPPAPPRAPVRGQPIFQRPRPQSGGAPSGPPGSRPSTMRPGERRPMHPDLAPDGRMGRDVR